MIQLHLHARLERALNQFGIYRGETPETVIFKYGQAFGFEALLTQLSVASREPEHPQWCIHWEWDGMVVGQEWTRPVHGGKMFVSPDAKFCDLCANPRPGIHTQKEEKDGTRVDR